MLSETSRAAAPAGNRHHLVWTAAMVGFGVALDLLVLALERMTPTPGATAILYAVPLVAALVLRSPRATVALAVAGSVCAIAGFALSPAGQGDTAVLDAAYRLAVILVVWSMALTALRQMAARVDAEGSAAAAQRQVALNGAILDTAPDAMVVIDPAGIVQSFSRSAEALFGFAADEVVGRNVSLLMAGGHREAHDGYLSRYVRTGERRIIGIGRVVEGRTKDGRVFPLELSVGEARVGDSRVFIGFIRDLSARQRIEEELRQAQKMEAIGQLTGGIAHDFNNLLTVIIGNLELLAMREDRVDRVALEEAAGAAELGAQLTAQLLAFGRRQPLSPGETDLADLVQEVASLLRRALGDDIELAVEIRGRPGRAVVDAAQLKNALINLAVNARDAMPKGGRLVVAVSNTEIDAAYAEAYPEVRLGRYVAVSVADNGCGMTEEVRERAFEPFFTTKPQGAGTGLGLSMVYGFAKQSRGHVDIDSEVGRGTTITLFLPRAEEQAPAPQPDARAAATGHSRGETILVVEDDPRVRRVVATRLAGLGYSVLEADGGREALALLEAAPHVALVFTDVVMPGGMSGFDLAREVRSRRRGARILFTSGFADPDVLARERAERPSVGAGILRKPYSRDQLARAVRAALDDGGPA